MPVSRREFLKTGAAAGALLLGRPWTKALGATLGPDTASAASRTSRLFPGTTLAHADLHNHSLLSDGDGDSAQAFILMRDAGLDVAALTDHTTLGINDAEACPPGGCAIVGINEERWQTARELADAAHADGSFVAIRGFEWSSPTMGHINVWFSERWIDPLHTGGATTGEGAAQFLHQEVPGADAFSHELDELVRQAPSNGTSMRAFYEWLRQPASTPGIGGGLDGIAGFNHPGREQGRFGYFAPDSRLAGQLVSLELMNRREDYIYEGTEEGFPSPLNDCLNKGWRVGLLGVTDEHGIDWGTPTGKGRGGIYVESLTRNGVKDAMKARRFFATRERGLRIDAAANGVRMGGVVPHTSGPIRFELDIDGGAEWYGRPLSVQVLRPGTIMPTVSHAQDVRVPVSEGAGAEPVISFEAAVNVADGDWVVLRVSDPARVADGRADSTWKTFGDAVAYTSPFFLQP
ncbi:MAG: twin-arginine translocation signal domain-containing protein [Actinomycetota bacterium]